MNYKNILPVLFVLLALVQIAVPIQMIWDKEKTIESGTTHYFKTQPVDPTDPFRGKYVALNFENDSWRTDTLCEIKSNDKVYAYLSTDSLGFATVEKLSLDQPVTEVPYFSTRVWYTSRQNDSLDIHLRLPFDRFYMEESMAPQAEIELTAMNRTDTLPTYAVVKIRKGNAVLEDVKVDDISLIDWINQINEQKQQP